MARRLRREEPGRLGEPGAVGCSSTGRRSGSDAGLGRRGRRLRGSPQSAPGPRPAPPPFSRTPAALTLEAPAGQPSEATGQAGPALAHLTLHPRQRGLRPARAQQLGRPGDQLIHGGRGFSAAAGRPASLKAGDHPKRRWGQMPTASGMGQNYSRGGGHRGQHPQGCLPLPEGQAEPPRLRSTWAVT